MIYAPTRSDFWNDPRLWDGINDPRKQMCWMEREVIWTHSDEDAFVNVGTSRTFEGHVFDLPRAGCVRVVTPNCDLSEYHHSELSNPRQDSCGRWFVRVPTRPTPEAERAVA